MSSKFTKNEKIIIEWERMQQKGKKKYFLTNAIISGIILVTATKLGWELNPNKMYSFTEYYFYPYISFFVGGFISGIIGSTIRWGMYEDKYNALLKEKEIQK